MKTVICTVAAASLLFFGCSKPPADEVFAKAEQAHQIARKQADTLHNRSRLAEAFHPALALFETVSRDYPGTPAGESATFMIAQILNSETRQDTLAVEGYKRFVKEYPDSKQAGISMFMIGYIYNNELKQFDSATAAYKRFLDRFPTHEMAMAAQQELDHIGTSPEEWLQKGSPSAKK